MNSVCFCMVDGETREMLLYPFICESYSSGKNEALKSNPTYFMNGCAK